MGRPRKLSPELTAQIVERIIDGSPPSIAANLSGISSSTFFSWMAKGRNCEGEFSEFLEAVERAFSQSMALRLGNINRAALKGDWRASAWLLEKMAPEEFGRTRKKIQEWETQSNKDRREVSIEELKTKIDAILALRQQGG